jgi:hypothetical protein
VQLETAKSANLARCWSVILGAKWHYIEAQDTCEFQVCKKVGKALKPHTYFAIIIDDLTTLTVWAMTNDVHRGDILADALGRTGVIRAGYGVLLFGTRVEVYAFDNGELTEIDGEESSEEDVEGIVHVEEPSVALCKRAADGQGLVVDLRTVRIQMPEGVFREVVGKEVEYTYEDTDDEKE